ncbi:MAG: hypothetical protein KIS66_07055 [Fimbriimonadaceae bacterium]|nr:hypothetical protein [Fimbriimonadaceae bacterium]
MAAQRRELMPLGGRWPLLLIALSWLGAGVIGCSGPSDDGLTKEQHATTDRFKEIVERSGGQWERLSEADRKFLVDDLSNGNENAARMMFAARSGKAPAVGPGGSPNATPPKGGP